MSKATKLNPDAMPVATRVVLGLLSEWWCVSARGKPAVILAAILAEFAAPGVGPDLLRDRLYGGFRCEKPERRHVFLDTSAFTSTGTNHPLDPSERLATWVGVLAKQHAPDGGFVGGGPFCDDAPTGEKGK